MKSAKNIGNLLAQIKKSERFEHRADPSQADERQRPTSLGAPLMRADEGRFRIDLSGVLVLSGLTELVGALAERFREQQRAEDADLLVVHPVSPSVTPELAALGVRRVVLHVRRKVAAQLVPSSGFLARQLRRVLGALQNSSMREDLFRAPSASGDAPHGRLFPFDAGDGLPEGFVLLEYEPDGAFLRVTIELENDQRLYLKRIPHRVVPQKESLLFEQDADALADQIALGLNQAGRSQREVHVETPDRLPGIFMALRAAGLSELSLLRFTWQGQEGLNLSTSRSAEWIRLIARTFLLLQEDAAIRVLAEGCEIELASEAHKVFLDVSRRGACLNIALGRRRQQTDLRGYLLRMPRLERLAAESKDTLAGVRVVFIHHFTAETLAVIAALRDMGCTHVHGLFIRYKGLLPDAFLEALMALPEQQFVFHSLTQVENEVHLTGRYLLAREFSPVAPLAALDEALRKTPLDYFKAMRAAACHIVMRQLLEARRAGQRVLLIEDGGYAAPVFNRWTAEKITLDEALRRSFIEPEEDSACLFGEWLAGVFVADVEHTRNGYDQLMDVRRQFGPPVYPSYTIALSEYKNRAEALGAAMSILMASEYLMAGQGDSLHHRCALVIGSRGFIGRHLLAQLAARNGADRVVGVDRVTPAAPVTSPTEVPALVDIPEELLARLDLVIGMTGHPVFTAAALVHILLKGASRRIYLVSGSTKNVEFAQVTEWLQNMRDREDARLGECPVRLEMLALRDPLTEIAQGSIVRIHFEGRRLPVGMAPEQPWKDLVLAADGMPLNFNFFGVPGDIMDRVMEQLLILCRIAVLNPAGKTGLYALDYNLNEQGQLIQGRELP